MIICVLKYHVVDANGCFNMRLGNLELRHPSELSGRKLNVFLSFSFFFLLFIIIIIFDDLVLQLY